MERFRPGPAGALALWLLLVAVEGGCGRDEVAASGARPAERGARTAPPAGDLCAGLVRDLDARPMTALARPALGAAVVDPQFGTRIRRITGASTGEGANAVIKPAYGTIQAWNADESRILLWHREKGHELYDGRSYAFLRSVKLVSPTDIEQVLWDPVDPDLLYYPSNYNAQPNLMRYRVSSNSSEVLHRFDNCPAGDWGRLLSLGSDPMYLSWAEGSKVIGLSCGEQKFLYDVGRNAILGRATIAGRVAPQPAPSGRLAYFDGKVYDSSLRVARSLPLAGGFEHASLGRSAATGHDLYEAVVFDPPRGGGRADVGTLVSFDMETGQRRVVVGPSTGYPYPPSGTHISAIAHRRPGWVAVSIVGDPRGQHLLDNELLLANVDSGTVCRVGHHRSWAGEGRWGYWGEPHVVISPSATRLLFGSDWGNGATVDTYVVELPGYAGR
ncbi:MAG TPA: hypothetical protein VMX54_03145 [Vicinamibacteria bacterium]|nr:hypothetical protein [Vicinamibacteria bacterium]